MPEPVTVAVISGLCFLVGGGVGHIVTREIDTYMLHVNKPEVPPRSDMPGRHHYTDEERMEEPMVLSPLRRDRTFQPQPFLVGTVDERDHEI